MCLKHGEGRTEINLVCHLETSTGTLTWAKGSVFCSVSWCVYSSVETMGNKSYVSSIFLWVERSEDRCKNWELDGQTETYSASKDTTTGYNFMLNNLHFCNTFTVIAFKVLFK